MPSSCPSMTGLSWVAGLDFLGAGRIMGNESFTHVIAVDQTMNKCRDWKGTKHAEKRELHNPKRDGSAVLLTEHVKLETTAGKVGDMKENISWS